MRKSLRTTFKRLLVTVLFLLPISAQATTLPTAAELTGPTVTQGQFKSKLNQWRDYNANLLGEDGTAATAQSYLGIPNATGRLANIETVVGTDGTAATARQHLGLASLTLDYVDRGAWLTATAYAIDDQVTQGGIAYLCVVAHTSGVFAVDEAAGKWVVQQGLTNVSGMQVINGVAALRTVTPTASRKIWLGYHTFSGDGGQGVFHGVTGAAPGTYVDNGGTIIVPTGGDGSAAWLRDQVGYISVRWFGATGDGVTDDSAAIQSAIDTGKHVYFPEGDYRAANLIATTAEQIFFADGGSVRIRKNANGPIVTFSARDQQCIGIVFSGDSATPIFTGHNVVSSGDNFTMMNCGSQWAAGRAVLATGSHVQIIGTNGVYQTVDTTATGYDIEIGVSGTATLYHQLIGISTSQATGGIKLVDTGTHVIFGGQFGKLTISKGSAPAGVSGGSTMGARILGDVLVESSNATFSGNQLSTGSFTFAYGTSGCVYGSSNIDGGGVFTNNGNANNLIIREVSAGSTNKIKYGDDSATAVMTIDNLAGEFKFSGLKLPNNKKLNFRNAADSSDPAFLNLDSSDNLNLVQTSTAKKIVAQVLGAGGSLDVYVDGGYRFVANASGLHIGDSTAPTMTSGAGSPEGVVAAVVGSVFMRTDGGTGTSMYVKEAGTGNTGWAPK